MAICFVLLVYVYRNINYLYNYKELLVCDAHTYWVYTLFQQWEKTELKSYLIKNETPQRNMHSIKF